jgi:hypothetical protein
LQFTVLSSSLQLASIFSLQLASKINLPPSPTFSGPSPLFSRSRRHPFHRLCIMTEPLSSSNQSSINATIFGQGIITNQNYNFVLLFTYLVF